MEGPRKVREGRKSSRQNTKPRALGGGRPGLGSGLEEENKNRMGLLQQVMCQRPPRSARSIRYKTQTPWHRHSRLQLTCNNARASPLKEVCYRRRDYENRSRSRSTCHNAGRLCRRASSIPWTWVRRACSRGPRPGRSRAAVVLPALGLLGR
jgi:hypothetical protein